MGRNVPFNPEAKCDHCGGAGAFDFMGDYYCPECLGGRQTAVNSVPQLRRGRVWCRHCRSERRVNAAYAMRRGWPKCCGYTMTIDHPDTWDEPA